MLTHKIFLAISNIMGVNFGNIFAPVLVIVIFQVLVFAIEFMICFYYPFGIIGWHYTHPIYSAMYAYQTQLPFFMQYFIMIRTFKMRSIQKKLMKELIPKFTQKADECEENFLKRFSLIVLVRCVKFLFGIRILFVVFNTQTFLGELIYTCNDLMFVYFVELMTENLKFINCKIQMIRTSREVKIITKELIEIFWLKRDIEKRYSTEVFYTVTYNFILNIISFYWVLMRIIFNHLNGLLGWGTFLHFIAPIFMLWIIFSKCEEFQSTLKTLERNLHEKSTKHKLHKIEMLTILLNSEESKFKLCGMIEMKIETLTDLKTLERNLHEKSTKLKLHKIEMLTILLNSEESKFKLCGMIEMKIETLTNLKNLEKSLYEKSTKHKLHKIEMITISLNSKESKIKLCGMIEMKIETLTDVSKKQDDVNSIFGD
ncbi:hypothetical protein PVAND_003189 [Polypedilum vanderplanki]|uniref:Gustatory receptor n=1 Tax=Polypedilum vanderplanki TaxID=319348 RepID=A0A9J6BUC8_POLVA|nr:hypothetical protein PVAND_003189 [Polypedilum vanderplanki]